MTERGPIGTADEVAEYYRIPLQSIYDQRHRGVGIGALGFKVGRHLRFRWSEVDEYLEQQRQAATQSGAA